MAIVGDDPLPNGLARNRMGQLHPLLQAPIGAAKPFDDIIHRLGFPKWPPQGYRTFAALTDSGKTGWPASLNV